MSENFGARREKKEGAGGSLKEKEKVFFHFIPDFCPI